MLGMRNWPVRHARFLSNVYPLFNSRRSASEAPLEVADARLALSERQ